MDPLRLSAFRLPAHLAAKADPHLLGPDDQHLAAVAAAVGSDVAALSARLEAELRSPGGSCQQAMDRDLEVARLTSRLRLLRRFGPDLCLGRMVLADTPEPVYVGRLGLTDTSGRRLLVDWRSPAAEPFFGATHARPMGLTSRRRYRWAQGSVVDYWDEVFTAEGLVGHAALDDQSAFVASLGASRSPRMRDVLATIQADQDAIVRAGSHGVLVVDGGPGTGKTVVALHRAAYLIYADPRLGHHRGGVLFVGPHPPYLAYVQDVLPGLGKEGVQTCTLRDLVAEGSTAVAEGDPEVARLKSSARLVGAVEAAVRFYEEPPRTATEVDTDWGEVTVPADAWAEAFASVEPGTPHNEAREQVRDTLVDLLRDTCPEELPPDLLRRDPGLLAAVDRAWPVLQATDLVGDLWSVPAYLRRCAPWLDAGEVQALQREEPAAWTVSDLPFLDAARRLLGDPGHSRRVRVQDAIAAAEREERAKVVEHLVAGDDSEMMVMSMLRGEDLQGALLDPAALPGSAGDPLAGPFAHVVVDEAQELTDAEWQMLLQRCPSRSFTVVGDRAQARAGFPESWRERLERVGLDRVSHASLTIGYRTPQEVMAEAEAVIRSVLPDANVPRSVRRSGIPVAHGSAGELQRVVDGWLEGHAEGTACVVATTPVPPRPRVQVLAPHLVKGLEFDLVVLLEPGTWSAVDRYVAMTRATRQLVVLTT